jgi:hypothetical protein
MARMPRFSSPIKLRSRLFKRGDSLPYEMFNHERLEREAKSARLLERVYHNGQRKIWDGKDLLEELVQAHGPVELSDEQRKAIHKMFSIILWGELAAWKVSAQLADRLEPLEAKMAATSQAHDEARHFYVMHDYLKLLGCEPDPLPPYAKKIMDMVLSTDDLAAKLMGMQLMVEPIALTLFQITRESGVEPVLCELLRYYERDEARHVALGVHYLPSLLKEMNYRQAVRYWTFQARMFALQLKGLGELEPEFQALGIDAIQAFRLGQGKQLFAAKLLAQNLGHEHIMMEVFKRAFDFLVVYNYSEDDEYRGLLKRFRDGLHAAHHGEAKPVSIHPEQPTFA